MSMFEASGLDQLVADLRDAPGRAQRGASDVIRKGAVNVMNGWREGASGLSHAPLYPQSITFDAGWEGGTYEAEIGPDKNLPQGALGNLIEYGSANNAPHADGAAALHVEAPKFEQAIEDLVDL